MVFSVGLKKNILCTFSSLGITSIKDEINYWKQKMHNKSSARLDREAAQVFISILENIEQRIR